MKKVKKPIEKYYKMPHIYKDDIEEIIKILEEAKFNEYKIKTNEYVYENIDEIPKDLISVDELIIYAGPFLYFRLYFKKDYACLDIEEDNILAKGLFKKIDEVLSKRERKILWFFSISGSFGSGIVALIVVTIFGILYKYYSIIDKNIFLSISIISIIFLILWVPVAFWLRFYKYSKIQFSKFSDRGNFFTKNKKVIISIVVNIISAVIGATIYALINKYF